MAWNNGASGSLIPMPEFATNAGSKGGTDEQGRDQLRGQFTYLSTQAPVFVYADSSKSELS